MTGVPDLLAVVEGEFFGLEVKDQKPGESKEHAYGRTSPQQRLIKSEINRAGATAVTVLSADEAVAVVEQRLKEKAHERESRTDPDQRGPAVGP